MCLYLANAGVIKCNWPYMDATNNCILFFGDPDNNGTNDIQFDVLLKSQWSYSSNPGAFNGNGQLGILVDANNTNQFIPFSQFTQTLNPGGATYTYKKNLSFPFFAFVGTDPTFSYSVSLVLKSGGKQPVYAPYNAFSNTSVIFENFASTPMNPWGSTSESATKSVCDPQGTSSPTFRLSNDSKANKIVTENSNLVNTNKLASNTKIYPNPFIEDFTIQYQLEEAQEISIEIFDAKGALKYTYNEFQNEGFQEKSINETALLKGIYFCRLTTANKLETFKLVKTH